MKKLLSTLLLFFATLTFAAEEHHHHHHDEMKLENAVTYKSVKDAKMFETELKIGTHDGELVADIDEIGHIHLNDIAGGYESTDTFSKIDVMGDNALLSLNVLMYDRSFYQPTKYEKEMSFHSYNAAFPHLHFDFNKDFTEVTLNHDKFKGTLTVDEETGNKIFTEKDGKFRIVVLSKADDQNSRLAKTPRLALVTITIALQKVK